MWLSGDKGLLSSAAPEWSGNWLLTGLEVRVFEHARLNSAPFMELNALRAESTLNKYSSAAFCPPVMKPGVVLLDGKLCGLRPGL